MGDEILWTEVILRVKREAFDCLLGVVWNEAVLRKVSAYSRYISGEVIPPPPSVKNAECHNLSAFQQMGQILSRWP